MALEIFKLNRIRYDQLYDDARSYLTSKFLQVGDVFTPASAYGQLLNVMIDLGKLIFYYVEDSITELNIFTATRDVSIRSLSRIAGHNPTRAIAASGTVLLTYNGNPLDIYGNTVIIPNFTRLVDNSTGLTYTITAENEEIRMNLTGKSSIEVKVTQGAIEAQTVTGTGRALQSYPIKPKKGALIDNFFINVFVNGEKWKVYDSVYDMPYETKGVVVKTGINDGIDLYFGNGFFGKKPDLGSSIRVEYLTTSGNEGNILLGEIPQFQFTDDVFDLSGNSVSVSSIIDISIKKPIIFGSDPEPIELTRILSPKTSRSYVLANADSYVYFLEKFNIFSVIDAFSTLDDNDISDDNVVYLFLIPDVNKRKAQNDDYFTVPVELFFLSVDEKEKIYDFIEQSGQKILTTIIKILDPIIKRYVININVTAFEGFSKEAIRQDIVSKCSDYFLKNRRRDRIPKSDLISIIETVPGVDSVNLWFVSQENEVFKSDIANAQKPDIGIDVFGDVVIGRGEYALIRGGWPDRAGYFYYDSSDQSKPGSINIAFSSKDTPKSLNMELHRINVDNIKNT
jgi:hypothetical protein